MYLCKWKRVQVWKWYLWQSCQCADIKKTLFSFCLHTENNIMSLHITSCASVPVSRLCHPSGDIVWSSDHCQQQLIWEKRASWAFPIYRDFRVYCSICHRPTSNSSNLNCYSRSSTVWIQARTWNCSSLVTQIDNLLLSVGRGQSLIFILLALSAVLGGSGQKLLLLGQEGMAQSKVKC